MVSFKRNNLNISVASKVLLIAVMDIVATAACYFFGLWLRYDFKFQDIKPAFLEGYVSHILPWCAITVAVLICFNLYNSIWVFVSTSEVFRIAGAYCVLGVLGVVFRFYGVAIPRSSCIVGFVFSFVCTVGIRFSYRLIRTAQQKLNHMLRSSGMKNVMIIGAGDAGRALANEFINSDYVRDNIACVIDDNPAKLHKRLCGVPIVGGRYEIPAMVKQYKISKIVFAIPSASAVTRKEILDICTTTGCEVQMLPGIYQMVNGEVSVSKLRKVDPQDLLVREPTMFTLDDLTGYISG